MAETKETTQDAAPPPKPVAAKWNWKSAVSWAKKIAVTLLGCLLIATGIAIGYMLAPSEVVSSAGTSAGESGPTTWTCSMHPQIKLPKPGKCPICFMELIPLADSGAEDEGPRQLTMSRRAVGLAEIETTPVIRKYATNKTRMVGKVDYDETKVANITAWVAGRLDRLFVDFTGVTVRKGDHLVSMYSPELIVAQRELIQTLNARNRLGEANRELTESNLRSSDFRPN